MTDWKAITPIAQGFSVVLGSQTTGWKDFTISQYELSRNNIKGWLIKSVKLCNFFPNHNIIISGDNDEIIIPPMKGVVLPIYLGHNDLNINVFWEGIMFDKPNTLPITFYHELQSNVVYDLMPRYI